RSRASAPDPASDSLARRWHWGDGASANEKGPGHEARDLDRLPPRVAGEPALTAVGGPRSSHGANVAPSSRAIVVLLRGGPGPRIRRRAEYSSRPPPHGHSYGPRAALSRPGVRRRTGLVRV